MLRHTLFGRLAGHEDVNDAERLWIVHGKATHSCAASPSQMGRFETRWLTAAKNLSALADPSGQWIDKVHHRRPPGHTTLQSCQSLAMDAVSAAIRLSSDECPLK